MEKDIRKLESAELRQYLENEKGILALYLFGSHSEGLANVRSDVDIALLLAPEVGEDRFHKYRLRYLSELRRFLKGKLDLIILNQVAPLLQFQALKNGQLIFDREPDVRAKLEMTMLNRYYLSKRFYDFQFEHLMQRIKKEGLGNGSQGHSSPLEEARRVSEKLNAL